MTDIVMITAVLAVLYTAMHTMPLVAAAGTVVVVVVVLTMGAAVSMVEAVQQPVAAVDTVVVDLIGLGQGRGLLIGRGRMTGLLGVTNAAAAAAA